MAWTTHTIAVAGGALALHERRPAVGAAEDGVPLVLLHGFTGSGRDWETVAALLPGAHVFAPDLPGHGETELDGVGFADAADAVVAALAARAVPRFALGGYSLGGRLALQVALARPQHVTRLVLESASAGIAAPAERAQRRADDEALAEFALEHGIDAFVDRWERTPVLAGEARLPEAERAALRARRLRCRPAGLAASLRRLGTGVQPWLGARLGELRLPVLLVAGEDDAKFRGIAAALQAALPDARLAVAPGAGHNVHLEQPAWFAARLAAFLAPARAGGDTVETVREDGRARGARGHAAEENSP